MRFFFHYTLENDHSSGFVHKWYHSLGGLRICDKIRVYFSKNTTNSVKTGMGLNVQFFCDIILGCILNLIGRPRKIWILNPPSVQKFLWAVQILDPPDFWGSYQFYEVLFLKQEFYHWFVANVTQTKNRENVTHSIKKANWTPSYQNLRKIVVFNEKL